MIIENCPANGRRTGCHVVIFPRCGKICVLDFRYGQPIAEAKASRRSQALVDEQKGASVKRRRRTQRPFARAYSCQRPVISMPCPETESPPSIGSIKAKRRRRSEKHRSCRKKLSCDLTGAPAPGLQIKLRGSRVESCLRKDRGRSHQPIGSCGGHHPLCLQY